MGSVTRERKGKDLLPSEQDVSRSGNDEKNYEHFVHEVRYS